MVSSWLFLSKSRRWSRLSFDPLAVRAARRGAFWLRLWLFDEGAFLTPCSGVPPVFASRFVLSLPSGPVPVYVVEES